MLATRSGRKVARWVLFERGLRTVDFESTNLSICPTAPSLTLWLTTATICLTQSVEALPQVLLRASESADAGSLKPTTAIIDELRRAR